MFPPTIKQIKYAWEQRRNAVGSEQCHNRRLEQVTVYIFCNDEIRYDRTSRFQDSLGGVAEGVVVHDIVGTAHGHADTILVAFEHVVRDVGVERL